MFAINIDLLGVFFNFLWFLRINISQITENILNNENFLTLKKSAALSAG